MREKALPPIIVLKPQERRIVPINLDPNNGKIKITFEGHDANEGFITHINSGEKNYSIENGSVLVELPNPKIY